MNANPKGQRDPPSEGPRQQQITLHWGGQWIRTKGLLNCLTERQGLRRIVVLLLHSCLPWQHEECDCSKDTTQKTEVNPVNLIET